MIFQIDIAQIQHVNYLSLELDLSKNGITCIVGKNGVGKTTLVRAIRNVASADTFIKTASRGIFSDKSSIAYRLGDEQIEFVYDDEIDSLNCKQPIPQQLRTLCATELPMPHGERFNFFQTVSEVDTDIRRQIILEDYSRPDELIQFLSDIYTSNKFDSLIETNVKGKSYYSILLADNRYVREDYLSSGEYFLINLYRTIKGATKLIVIDEIDLSLDAGAQVHLLRKLREFCAKYECNMLFTTHSLAMMRMLGANELLYMSPSSDGIDLAPASYSYIKSILFGFVGWDRYILTEDGRLIEFIDFIIQTHCSAFFSYKLIYAGGASQVVDLLKRNRKESFLAESGVVIAVLDGDQDGERYAKEEGVYLIPVQSVEKAIGEYYEEPDFPYKLAPGKGFNGSKDLVHSLLRDKVASLQQLFAYIFERNKDGFSPLIETLNKLLSP
jgi:ABC-type dipeptide/oligopeptide/nickel transport system ATPase subunit